MMSKKNMFKKAHMIAKRIVFKTNNYRIAFSFALKYVWKAVVKWGKKRFTDHDIDYAFNYLTKTYAQRKSTFGIPNWFLYKNLTEQQQYVIFNVADDPIKERETEKAVKYCFGSDFGNIWLWVPKSLLVV